MFVLKYTLATIFDIGLNIGDILANDGIDSSHHVDDLIKNR